MGTSSRQPAPTGGDWTRAKTRMTNWARSDGGNDDLARAALGAFVGALGGAAAAAASATGGVRAASGLGEFLSDVSREGLDTTLDRYGLEDLVGGEPLEVLNEIASRVAGAGDSPEEAVAREAVLEVLAELFEDTETFADMDAVEIDADILRDFLARYLTEYIYQRLLHDLGDRITDNADSPEDAARLEQRMQAQIRDLVALDLSTIDPLNFDWQSDGGQERMRELLADAFRMISAGE
jgi:hypothetical protein